MQRATQPVCGVANSAKFFDCDVCTFFSATAFILHRFLISLYLSHSPSLGVWRQVGVAAAAWLKVFRFPSGRTYTVSTLPVCVNGNVAYACFFFFLRTVGHFWQTQQQQQQQRRLRVQSTIDGAAIL